LFSSDELASGLQADEEKESGADGTVGEDSESDTEQCNEGDEERDEGPPPGSLSARLSVVAADAEVAVSGALEAMTRSSFVTSSDQRSFVFGEGEVGIVLANEANPVNRLMVLTLTIAGLALRQGVKEGDCLTHINKIPLRKLPMRESDHELTFQEFILGLLESGNSQKPVSVSFYRQPPPEELTEDFIVNPALVGASVGGRRRTMSRAFMQQQQQLVAVQRRLEQRRRLEEIDEHQGSESDSSDSAEEGADKDASAVDLSGNEATAGSDDEDAPEDEMWEESNRCWACEMEFDMFNRRHHCRKCHRSFCDQHSRRSVCIPSASDFSARRLSSFAVSEPMRVCDSCYHEIRATTRNSLEAHEVNHPVRRRDSSKPASGRHSTSPNAPADTNAGGTTGGVKQCNLDGSSVAGNPGGNGDGDADDYASSFVQALGRLSMVGSSPGASGGFFSRNVGGEEREGEEREARRGSDPGAGDGEGRGQQSGDGDGDADGDLVGKEQQRPSMWGAMSTLSTTPAWSAWQWGAEEEDMEGVEESEGVRDERARRRKWLRLQRLKRRHNNGESGCIDEGGVVSKDGGGGGGAGESGGDGDGAAVEEKQEGANADSERAFSSRGRGEGAETDTEAGTGNGGEGGGGGAGEGEEEGDSLATAERDRQEQEKWLAMIVKGWERLHRARRWQSTVLAFEAWRRFCHADVVQKKGADELRDTQNKLNRICIRGLVRSLNDHHVRTLRQAWASWAVDFVAQSREAETPKPPLASILHVTIKRLESLPEENLSMESSLLSFVGQKSMYISVLNRQTTERWRTSPVSPTEQSACTWSPDTDDCEMSFDVNLFQVAIYYLYRLIVVYLFTR
jgi:hypothetical protein